MDTSELLVSHMQIGEVYPLIGDLPQNITFSLEKILCHENKRQSVVSRSSVKSEYRTMENVTCELVWIRELLTELGFAPKCPMRLYCDNEVAIHIAKNLVFYEHTKHIEVDCHSAR